MPCPGHHVNSCDLAPRPNFDLNLLRSKRILDWQLFFEFLNRNSDTHSKCEASGKNKSCKVSIEKFQIRALLAVWIFHDMQGGTPLLTRLLDIAARDREVRLKARQKSLRKYFDQFFAKVNIEVSKCHQRSNLAKIWIPSEMRYYLRNYFR